MNEWSPGGTYRPVTPNQMRSFRSHWDDQNIDKNSVKPLVVNIKAVAETRSRSNFQRSQEDISKTSLSASNRIKKLANGSSDPRFKRVITSSGQNDACVGTEMKKISKPSSPAGAKEQSSQEWNVITEKPRHQRRETAKVDKVSKRNEYRENAVDYSNTPTQEPVMSDSVKEHLKEVDKLSFNHDIVSNAVPKQSRSLTNNMKRKFLKNAEIVGCRAGQSVSATYFFKSLTPNTKKLPEIGLFKRSENSLHTINTRNASLVSEDFGDDYGDRLRTFSSTTRVKKVQNWIAEQKPKLDKKQSVITVIGQTQGQSPLSSAFHEIDQRRKLVKELDKYAICSKITDSEKDKEMNTLVAQINFLSPSGKLLLSGEKNYDVKDFQNRLKSGNAKNQDGGDKMSKHLDKNYENVLHCDNEVNTEQETSLSHSCESFMNHNGKKRTSKWEDKYDIRGKIRGIVSRIPYPFLAYFMILISGALCWYTYFTFQKNGYFIFELFPQKPKTTTWYEKVCYWIWELFRPSANYHRSSPWSPR